ncbi:unnamed protein product [Sphenostylis stenocarpa]|uniref:PIN-like protein n=1 Tax=Sphenostylis stenocarpa TaxID=92480 RepID=A0AA86TBL5_9FABA|nr:unnamed protein product [Sphenostylis stenocarpa]
MEDPVLGRKTKKKIEGDSNRRHEMPRASLFMGLQPKMMTCGKTRAMISMVVKFLVGPMLILATSKAIGINGVLLRVVVVQAALPQGLIPFIFAKEYNLHADILSTA